MLILWLLALCHVYARDQHLFEDNLAHLYKAPTSTSSLPIDDQYIVILNQDTHSVNNNVLSQHIAWLNSIINGTHGLIEQSAIHSKYQFEDFMGYVATLPEFLVASIRRRHEVLLVEQDRWLFTSGPKLAIEHNATWGLQRLST
jgi:hypothetical protein